MQIFPVFLPNDGCPHACLFCDQKVATGGSGSPDPDQVTAWLDGVLPSSGEGEIAYYGGSFSALAIDRQEAYLDAARPFVKQGRVSGVRISTRPDALATERVAALAASGVTTVEIGCQSFDDAVLTASRRGHTALDIHAAVRTCRAAGLVAGLQLMPGLPASSSEEALASLREALSLQPAFVRIYPALVFRGTQLAELWRCGRFQPLSLDHAVEITARQLFLCRRAGVPVIRLGLQSQPGLEKEILAGPYHPAFGQLVRSRLWRRALACLTGERLPVLVHPDDLSDALGHGRENLVWLKQHHDLGVIRADREVRRGTFLFAGAVHQLLDSKFMGDQL